LFRIGKFFQLLGEVRLLIEDERFDRLELCSVHPVLENADVAVKRVSDMLLEHPVR
jgi:hypothetical protein